MSTTQAVTVTRFGGPEVLELRDLPMPGPGPGEVRVAVEAAALCYTDMLIRRNLYPDNREKPPFTIGYDWVGRIDALGDGVSGWSVGDRVADLSVIGGAARHLTAAADRLVRVPEEVDAAEAESLILSYLTAWQAMTRTGGARRGDPVLVIGATGAVGLAALDLARAEGMIATGVAGRARADEVEARGATAIAYDEPGYEAKLREASEAAGGFACVVDSAGAIPARRLAGLVRPGGAVAVLGFAGKVPRDGGGSRMGALAKVVGTVLQTGIGNALTPGKRLSFYNIGWMRKSHPDWYAEDLAFLMQMLAQRRVSPEIARTWPMSDPVAAHEALEAGGFAGRLSFTPG